MAIEELSDSQATYCPEYDCHVRLVDVQYGGDGPEDTWRGALKRILKPRSSALSSAAYVVKMCEEAYASDDTEHSSR